ncbi:MAG: sulfotransferase [Verrucomicrobiota bacterium]
MRLTLAHCKPAFLGGFRFGDWLSLLGEPGRRIDPEFRVRAAVATMLTMATSALSRFEPEVKLTPAQEAAWERPVFVLGLPRSGTSMLHQLLARNPSLCFASKADCYHPHTLLAIRQLGLHRIMTRLNPARSRSMDGVLTGWELPEEDNIAIGILTGFGIRVDSIFGNPVRDTPCRPAMPEHFAVPWQAAFRRFSRKLAMVHGLPALFKSPTNTVSIPWILRVFPQARFITIFRHPHSHFQSLMATDAGRDKYAGWNALRRRGTGSTSELAAFGGRMANAYFATRGLIGNKNLCEVRYEDLVNDPVTVLAGIHEHLSIPGFDALAEHVRRDQQRQRYQRNHHPTLSAADVALVNQSYASLFAHCGYQPTKAGPAA